MDKYTAQEQAYKNGYAAGKRDAVAHGRWIWTVTGQEDYEQYYRCSECNEHSYIQFKYCPDCGARMDLESEGMDE